MTDSLTTLERRALVDDSARLVLADAYLERGLERVAAYLRAPTFAGRPRREVADFANYWNALPNDVETDRALFTLAVRDCYRAAGHVKRVPEVFWVESPLQVIVGGIWLDSWDRKSPLKNHFYREFSNPQLRKRLIEQLEPCTHLLSGKVFVPVSPQWQILDRGILHFRLSIELIDSFRFTVGVFHDQICADFNRYVGGGGWAEWWKGRPMTCSHEMLPAEGERLLLTSKLLRHKLAMRAACESSPIWYPCGDFVIACVKPSISKLDYRAAWPDGFFVGAA